MTTMSEIIAFVEAQTGHSLNRDEGIGFGPHDRQLTGVTVSWMATPAAIHAAGRRGHELLIGHESLYYPYNAPDAPNLPKGWENWQTNQQRRAHLVAYGLTFLRLHGSVDEVSIFDDFANVLELGEPVVSQGLTKVYEIAPRSLGDLVDHVKIRLGMDALRVSLAAPDDVDRLVHRVGLPWGGLGLFVNVSYQQELVELGCDVFIAGESDAYGFRFAQECSIPLVETSHEISENPGLRRFTALLSDAFPDVTFEFFEVPNVWTVM